MSQLYNIYQSDTFLLAKSVVLKFGFISDQINQELRRYGYLTPDDPRHHKYYLNLAGEYHASDHDRLKAKTGNEYLMVKVATDTGYEEIPLTKELLHGPQGNGSLLNEYQLGSTYHGDLLRRYPEYESLIKGLICPIDLDIAISAPDGTILSMGYQCLVREDDDHLYHRIPETLSGTKVAKLIQAQEDNLIKDLEWWVKKTLFRWFNGGYSYTDDLYIPYFLGILYSQIPAKLMNLRLANTFTGRVHTFHVREYLESHGQLGKYVDIFPFEQTLYLYRNLRHFNLNMGKEHTFKELIDNILTPLGIPLAGYEFQHDISEMDGVEQLLPESKLGRTHLNFKSIGAGSDWKTVRQVLDKQIPLAKDNGLYLNMVEQEIHDEMSWSGDDYLLTKILESELIEATDPDPVEFNSMAVWLWGYLASRGWYRGGIFVANPVSDERISLTPLNAFILAIYCLHRGIANKALEEVPNGKIDVRWITASISPQYVPLDGGYSVRPTVTQLKENLWVKDTKDEKLAEVLGSDELGYEANSPRAFYALAKQHHNRLTQRFFLTAKEEDLYDRGYLEYAFKRSYWHSVPLTLTDEPMDYKRFLRITGIDFSDYTQRDYYTLFERLVIAATLDSVDYEFSLKAIQKAAIDLLRHFSSYTTHYLYTINENAVTNSQGKYPRISNIEADAEGGVRGGVYIDLDVLDVDATGEIVHKTGSTLLEAVNHGLMETDIYGGRVDLFPKILCFEIDRSDKAINYDVDILGARLIIDNDGLDTAVEYNTQTWVGKRPPDPPKPFDPNSVYDELWQYMDNLSVTYKENAILDYVDGPLVQKLDNITVIVKENVMVEYVDGPLVQKLDNITVTVNNAIAFDIEQ